MARKLIFTISLLVLATVLTGASFANNIPTDVIFGTSNAGWISVTANSVAFGGGVHGTAYQGQNVGTYAISDSSNSMPAVTVTVGSDTLVGTFSVTTFTIISSKLSVLSGTFDVTGATPGFVDTGFPLGAMVDADLQIYSGRVSSGEIVADPIPEPGTIAMVGSGLLIAAGVLRRKLL